MDCRGCGHKNREGAKFCDDCGDRLVSTCPSCSTLLRTEAKFCDECGTPVKAESADAASRSPSDYTPKHLADRILQSKSALEGERKQVTVLFVDVKGSMDLAAKVDPEAWHGIMDRFFEILTSGVHRFEGTVNQYTGDGIMALFGAPIAHEDHAHRACYTAVHLNSELESLSEQLRREQGLDFSARIGLNSGDVVVGRIGDDLRMDYTAQGHTVGLAARLESLAEAHRPYLSESTAKLVEGFFDLEDLGEFDVKGALEPVRAFALEGVGAARTRFDLARRRGLARLVGRESELASLEATLEQARVDRGRVVGIVAEAGIGKSHLCTTFVEHCRERGIRVFEARGLAHGRHVPLLPMIELFRAFFGIEDNDDDTTARTHIADRLLPFDERLRKELPILNQFLGIPDPDEPLGELDPEIFQQRLFSIVRAIVHADGESDASVLLVEDLHWLDAASNALLSQIVETQAHTPGFIVLNFRPEYEAPWLGQAFYQQINLAPLAAQPMALLVRDRVGSDESIEALAPLVFERSRGNPFFAEEIVQELIETGVLVGEPGHYQASSKIETLDVPDTVLATLSARIDRLPERAKAVLQTASVIGKTFPEPVLRRVADLEEQHLAEALRQLVEAEFLVLEILYPETEYAFKHPLTQEVAYNTQLVDRRQATHEIVARTLEQVHHERLDENSALLAHHWDHAGEPLLSAQWHARAARWIGANDYREAYTHWERVARLTEGLDDREALELRAKSARGRLDAGFREGIDLDLLEPIYREGRDVLERLGDYAGSAAVAASFAQNLQSKSGDMRRYRETALEALRIAEQCDDLLVQAVADIECAWSAILVAEIHESRAASDRAIARIGDEVGEDSAVIGYHPLSLAKAVWVYASALLGEVEDGPERIDEYLNVSRLHAPGETLAWTYGFALFYWEIIGDVDKALEFAKLSRATADTAGAVHALACSHNWMGMALCLAERWSEAEEQLSKARALCQEKVVARDFEPCALAYLSESQLHTCGPEVALETAEYGLDISDRWGARLFGCRNLLAKARALRPLGGASLDLAEETIAQGEETARAIDAVSWVPHFRLERAFVARDRGDRDRFQTEAENAISQWRDLGVYGWAKRAEEELSSIT